MGTSVKRNYVLNLINTVSGLLFPLITFPYASRVLLAEGIGKVQFFDSIIGYILLLTSLGIPLYAIREVAKVRNDPKEKSKVTMEILLLHCFLTFFAYLLVLIIAFTVDKIHADMPLFFLLSGSLLFTAIGVFWFYQATEDFMYITVRAVSIKIIAAIALFTLVKERDDILWYAAINTCASVGNNIFNFIRLRGKINVKLFSFGELNISRHLKPALKIFTLNMIVSISLQLDTVMLGFMKSDAAVGYYTAASKLTRMSLAVLTSLGGVLLPRFSNYISTGRIEEFNELAGKSFSYLIAVALPMVAGLILLAEPIIGVFSGSGYLPSIPTLQAIAPIILFVGISGFLGMQILYPLGKENLVILVASCTTVVNVLCNLVLIPRYAQVGAAIASSVSELTGMVVVIFIAGRYLKFSLFSVRQLNYVVGTVIMTVVVYLISGLNCPDIVKICISVPCGVIVYGSYLLATGDYYATTVLNILVGKSSADN